MLFDASVGCFTSLKTLQKAPEGGTPGRVFVDMFVCEAQTRWTLRVSFFRFLGRLARAVCAGLAGDVGDVGSKNKKTSVDLKTSIVDPFSMYTQHVTCRYN